MTRVEIPKGAPRLDAFNVVVPAEAIAGDPTEFRLRGRDSKRYRILVKMSGNEGWVEFQTESRFGGKDTRRIVIKNQ